jgi:hypothetical protein
MTLSRRRLLDLAASAAVLASGPAFAQMSGVMPGPEEMQVVQRGGLYANLKDPTLPSCRLTPLLSASPIPHSPIRREAGPRLLRWHAPPQHPYRWVVHRAPPSVRPSRLWGLGWVRLMCHKPMGSRTGKAPSVHSPEGMATACTGPQLSSRAA